MKQAGGSRFQTLVRLLALEGPVERIRDLQVPADSISWSRFFGSLLLALLVLLFLSGAFMALYYSPVPGTAYDSIDFAQFNLPFGDVIRGIHHYSWNLLLIVAGLQMIRAFVLGTYKAPRERVWISGVVILLFIPSLVITGDLLPWNQKGYWTTQVRMSIIGSVPFVGDLFVRVLQGGSITGIVALTRFYILHILFLPSVLVILMAVHFYFLYQAGLSDILWLKPGAGKKAKFFPVIFQRWLLVFLTVTIILGLAARHWIVPLGDPADPTDFEYVPKPEWWVLFLNQLVTIFKGPFSIVGSVIIPLLLVGLLTAVPFLDRSSELHPFKRLEVMVPAVFIGLVLLGLSIIGYLEHFGAAVK